MSLFTPAWKSKDTDRALKAIKKITNQSTLLQIVVADGVPRDRRYAALERLTDENALKTLLTHPDVAIRISAMEKLDSAEVWQERAMHEDYRYNCELAVAHISDQKVLEKLVAEADSDYTREAAVRRLTNQELLEKLARSSRSGVQLGAIRTMQDTHKAAEIALEFNLDFLAEDMLPENDPLLVTIAKRGNSVSGKITDPALILDIIQSSDKSREFARSTIRRLSTERVFSLCLNTENEYTCSACYHILAEREALSEASLHEIEAHACGKSVRQSAHVKLMKSDLLRRTEGTERGKMIAQFLSGEISNALMKISQDEDTVTALVIRNFECGGSYTIYSKLKELYLTKPSLRPAMQAHDLKQYNTSHRDMYGKPGSSCHVDADAIEFDFME